MEKKRVKWTLESAREFFATKGCELLATEYKNSTVKMEYKCKCGELATSTMNSFQQGHTQCKDCGRKQSNAAASITQKAKCAPVAIEKSEHVKKEFASVGCTMISDYINAKTNIKYICSCGNESEILYRNFKEGGRCMKCKPERIEKMTMEKYGVKSTLSLPETRAKITNTNIERYGVANVGQVKEVRDKIKTTMVDKYGVESPFQSKEILEKRKQTNLQKYGVEYYIQTEEGKSRRKKTMIDKYGCDAAHVAEFRSKSMRSSYQTKQWVSPGGKLFTYQGYELLTIKQLIANGIDEDDIYTEDMLCESGNMPEFWYMFDGTRHRYFPDLFIKSKNKFIEVKSEFTFNTNPEKVLAKADCVVAEGYAVEIWTYNGKKKLVSVNEV